MTGQPGRLLGRDDSNSGSSLQLPLPALQAYELLPPCLPSRHTPVRACCPPYLLLSHRYPRHTISPPRCQALSHLISHTHPRHTFSFYLSLSQPPPSHPLISYTRLLASRHPSRWFHSSVTPSAAPSPLLSHQNHTPCSSAPLADTPLPLSAATHAPSHPPCHMLQFELSTPTHASTLIDCAINHALVVLSLTT